MNEYLKYTTDKLKNKDYSTLTIVLGNESCDLDSAISSIVYATFLNWQYNTQKGSVCTKRYRDDDYKDCLFIPILNVDREDYALKTEVAFCLREISVDESFIIFKDDFNLENILRSESSKVVLVDHHVLAKEDEFLAEYVTEIIDHRPLDKSGWKYKDDVRSTIEIVGSCSTLVCDRMRAMCKELDDFFAMYSECADLLYNTIILDTVNFSKEVNKATPLDEDVVGLLENALKVEDIVTVRETKLAKLVAARKDISSLTAGQLLRKDVKIVGTILAPSFPIPVSEFLQKPNAQEDMHAALTSKNCRVIVLLGMKLDGASVTRDLAVYSQEDNVQSADQLATLLESWSHPPLKLERRDTNISNCHYYQQNNLSASRKQVVPVLMEFLKKSLNK